MTTFYHPGTSSDAITSTYLGKAKEHLDKLMSTLAGRDSHSVKYAKVLALLGEPTELVESAFQSAMNNHDAVKAIKAGEQFGCYYLAMNCYEKAEYQFQMALENSRNVSNVYFPLKAKRGLQLARSKSKIHRH